MAESPEFIRVYEKLYGVTFKKAGANNVSDVFLTGDQVEFVWGSNVYNVLGQYGENVWVQTGKDGPFTAQARNLKAYVKPKPKVGEVWQYTTDGVDSSGFRIIGVDENVGIYWMVQESSFEPGSNVVTYGPVPTYDKVPDNERAHKFGHVWKRPLNNVPSHFVKKVDA